MPFAYLGQMFSLILFFECNTVLKNQFFRAKFFQCTFINNVVTHLVRKERQIKEIKLRYKNISEQTRFRSVIIYPLKAVKYISICHINSHRGQIGGFVQNVDVARIRHLRAANSCYSHSCWLLPLFLLSLSIPRYTYNIKIFSNAC